MIYFLDTHAVIWLYEGKVEKFSESLKQTLQNNDLFISPMVKLELQYLYEIKRTEEPSSKVCDVLYKSIGLQVHHVSLDVLMEKALAESWTRDPFDRLIVAHARLCKGTLLSKDSAIQEHYSKTIW